MLFCLSLIVTISIAGEVYFLKEHEIIWSQTISGIWLMKENQKYGLPNGTPVCTCIYTQAQREFLLLCVPGLSHKLFQN